jgi:aminopeptidase N
MNGKRMEIKLSLPRQPLRLDIDPEFDLFRKLSPDEIPPAISQALGSQKMLIILPSEADGDLLNAYRKFAQSLAQSGPDETTVKIDTEINKLPGDQAVTVLGWENRFSVEAVEALSRYHTTMSGSYARIGKTFIPLKNHSFVFTTRLPGNQNMALSLIIADIPQSLIGLANKLPHYHKYSYLAFEGSEPTNVAKGRWAVEASPLTVFLPAENGTVRKVEMAKLSSRKPLAILVPLFSR